MDKIEQRGAFRVWLGGARRGAAVIDFCLDGGHSGLLSAGV